MCVFASSGTVRIRFCGWHTDCWDENGHRQNRGSVPGVADAACSIDPNECADAVRAWPRAEAANINVANFTEPAKQTAALNRNSDHEAVLRFDPSGPFYARSLQARCSQMLHSVDGSRPEEIGDGPAAPGKPPHAIGSSRFAASPRIS